MVDKNLEMKNLARIATFQINTQLVRTGNYYYLRTLMLKSTNVHTEAYRAVISEARAYNLAALCS